MNVLDENVPEDQRQILRYDGRCGFRYFRQSDQDRSAREWVFGTQETLNAELAVVRVGGRPLRWSRASPMAFSPPR